MRQQLNANAEVPMQQNLESKEIKILQILLQQGGDIPSVADVLLDNQHFVSHVAEKIALRCSNTMESLGNRKHGNTSVLMKKTYHDCSSFSWTEIHSEFQRKFPELCTILNGILISSKHSKDPNMQEKHTKWLGIIYAIAAQARNPCLSLVQRLMSLCLLDNIADQKVSKTI